MSEPTNAATRELVEKNWDKVQQNIREGEAELASDAPMVTLDEVLQQGE